MLITQTRRRFLATVSMAGGAVFLRAPPVPAAEGALEIMPSDVCMGAAA